MAEPVPSPLATERARIERIVGRLKETADPIERADLGSELVRALSRYEDTVERAVLPHLERVAGKEALDRQRQAREALRDVMTVVHERTSHIDPRNVHVSDPEGFEQALTDVVTQVEEHLPTEDVAIAQLWEPATTSTREEIARKVHRVAASASERPRPPRTAIGRALSNAHVRLDHTIEDVATPHHPGSPVIDPGSTDQTTPPPRPPRT